MRRIGILCLCLYAGLLPAQVPVFSSWGKKTLPLNTPPPWSIIDSTFLPETVRLISGSTGIEIPPALYSISGSTIYWNAAITSIPFPLYLRYQTLPGWLARPLFLYTPPPVSTRPDTNLRFTYRPYTETTPSIQFRKLDYSGRFTRGFTVGNTQDLGLNAAFNLQLNGDLGDGIQIQAAISDENLPLQPEGNSLQLRDFDRVYIHLQRSRQSLTAGDYDLEHHTGHFMRYASRLQGVLVKIGQEHSTQQAALAIARGKFTRYVLSVQEGNQGPYQLSGGSGEPVAVVIAGTERIWHNGELLQRGSDYDYTIDYNRGELTFTWRRRILRESRITIEYEYADQNFIRSIYTLELSRHFTNTRLYAHFYSRQDSRTPSSNLALSESDRQSIQLAGDDPQKSFISGIYPTDTYLPSRVYYTWKDTLTSCGQTDSILFLSSPADTQPRVTARFSFVGQGKGNYRLYEQPLANERVYYWVAPDAVSCLPGGDYEPIIHITPPQQQQLLVLGQEWNKSRLQLQTEMAFSHLDKNRLSNLDQTDDIGGAAFLHLKYLPPSSSHTQAWHLSSQLDVEIRQPHFQELNPYRSPEFLRDWSLAGFNGQGTITPSRELLSSLSTSLTHPQKGSVSYQSQTYQRSASYQGLKQALSWSFVPNTWDIKGNIRLLNARTTSQKIYFFQPALTLLKKFPRWNQHTLFLTADAEQNSRLDNGSSNLDFSSFAYYQIKTGAESAEEKKLYYKATYSHRKDWLPYAGDWTQAALAQELIASGRWNPKPATRIQGDLSYRQLKTNTDFFSAQTPSRNSLLGRIDVTFQTINGLLRNQTLYELGSGQEPRQEFTYIKVAPGEGTYIWQDSLYNQDGLIQPAEMQLAPFPDQADYVRVQTIANRYVQVDYIQLSQHLQVEPRTLWKSMPDKRIHRFISKLSAQSSWKTQQKTAASTGGMFLLPRSLSASDSTLVGLNEQFRQSILFNRGHPRWELQWATQYSMSKQLQVAGFEVRGLRESNLLLRWNPTKGWSVRTQAAQGQRQNQISWMNSRNYLLTYQKIESQLSWAMDAHLRAQLAARFQSEYDMASTGLPHAKTLEIKPGGTLTPKANTALSTNFSFVWIAFEGDTRTPAGFAVLNGLQPGRNWLWNISLERQLNRTLQLRVQYDGRKTGQNQLVHNGNLQISAVF